MHCRVASPPNASCYTWIRARQSFCAVHDMSDRAQYNDHVQTYVYAKSPVTMVYIPRRILYGRPDSLRRRQHNIIYGS